MHLRLLFTICLLASTLLCQAQADSTYMAAPIQFISKHKGHEIMLRWGYNTPNDWLQNRYVSFDLYRRELGKDSEYELIKENIKVLAEEELGKLYEAENSTGVAAVADAYYGDWVSMNNAQFGILDRKDELESKFLMLHYACDIYFEAAEYAGLGFRDTNVNPNQNYIYKLAPRANEFMPKHESAIIEDLLTPVKIDQWAENEGSISIGWSRMRYEKLYTGYRIEKSSDNQNWEILNELPYVHAETEDVDDMDHILWQEDVDNYQPAYYRVRGIDAFGEWSEPSESIRLMGKDRTPTTLPSITKTRLNEDQTHVEIEWETTEGLAEDLDYYVLQKSIGNSASTFHNIAQLDKNQLSYRDDEVNISTTVYYKLCAVDTAKNYSCTDPSYAIIADKIAPAKPSNLTGTIDTNGVVTLKWKLGDEPDLMGYNVQYSNGRERVFVAKNDKPIKADHWRDTIPLDVLTEEIYYQVSAVDLRYNVSQSSEIIQLKKPDIVPPTPSIFTGYSVEDEYINIEYALSQSKDVLNCTLIRKDENGKTTEYQLPLNTRFYKDKDILPGKRYRYSILTIDDADHKVWSPQSLNIKSKTNRHKEDLVLNYSINGDQAQLSWNELQGEVDYIKIYKGQDAKSIRRFRSIQNGNNYSVKLNDISKQWIRVRYFYKDGSRSAISNAIQIL